MALSRSPGAPGLERVLASIAVAIALCVPARAQLNLGFETVPLDASAEPPGWRMTDEHMHAELDTTSAASGARSLHLTRENPSGIGRVVQEIGVEQFDGNRLRLSVRIRNGEQGSATPGLWIRVEGDIGLLYADSVAATPAADSSAWPRYELEAPLAETALRLTFGVELRGRGDAWFDELAIESFQASSLPPPSPVATRYVERALAIIEENSVLRARIDWPAFRSAVLEQARGADTIADSHLAVRFATSHLRDGHSYFMAPRQMTAIASEPVSNARTGRERVAPHGTVLASSIGYLTLPGFAGGTHDDQARFAAELQTLVASLDTPPVCGFILDLRGNSGGNLWPMLAGIGPLLGDGEIGAAIDPSGERTGLWYRDGKAGLSDRVQLRIRGTPYRLRDAAAPVAVITDRSTASAAEVIAGAFAARPATRRFGSATRGAVTGTRIFPLDDGAALVLAVAQTSDREGNIYTGPLEPDEIVDTRDRSVALADQSVVRAALVWLESRPECHERS